MRIEYYCMYYIEGFIKILRKIESELVIRNLNSLYNVTKLVYV